MASYKTNVISDTNSSFASMMEKGFGIVTVMNAKVYEAQDASWYAARNAYQVLKDIQAETCLCELDTLKIANVTEEGPSKTITGGKYSNAIVKFGKSARLEMQDALGNGKAIEALCGGIREWSGAQTNVTGLHFGEDFQGPKTIVGESFFIDREKGQQVDVNIIFYQFLPDSIFNLTQDAEGDASVFDMNGDLLTTEVVLGTDANPEPHGVFYSIVPKSAVNNTEDDPEDEPVTPTKVTVKLIAVTDDQTAVDVVWPIAWANGIKEVEPGTSVTLPNLNNPSGYTFDAFYSDDACSNTVLSPVVINEDMNIYVKFNHN